MNDDQASGQSTDIQIDLDSVTRPTTIGSVTESIVSLIKYDKAPGVIKIGPTNVRHMKDTHARDYELYKDRIIEILENPDYVGTNPGDDSIQFIKVLDRKVAVAVRVSANGTYYCRSVYALRESQFNSYLEANRLFRYTAD